MIFKKKKIIIEACTFNGELSRLFPPVYARQSIPDWYSNLQPVQEISPHIKEKSIKHCVGFKDLLNVGFVLPSWSEFQLTVRSDGIIDIASPMPSPAGASHPLSVQVPGAWKNSANVKLHSPWYFKCSEPIKWFWATPAWHQKNPNNRIAVPGVTEFKHYHQTHTNLLYEVKNQSYTDHINPGDPLVHFIPLTDRQWELKIKIINQDSWAEHFAPWDHSFNYIYQKSRSILERGKK